MDGLWSGWQLSASYRWLEVQVNLLAAVRLEERKGNLKAVIQAFLKTVSAQIDKL